MKRITRIFALALVFIFLSNFAVFAADNDIVGNSIYSDWSNIGAKYKDAVLSLSIHSGGLNIFQGSDGKFNPKEVFTRAEVLALVAVVTIGGNPDRLELNTLFATDAAREPRFYDVPKTHWAYGAINYAARMGFIEGTGGNIFNPTAPATVDMVNSMLLSLLGVKAEDKNGTDWIARTTAFMVTYNVRLDADVINFNPTREEVASALYVAVNTKVFQKNADGTYSQKEKTLLQTAFGIEDEEQTTVTITGKVVGTKYASLNEVNNYNRSVLLEGVGVNDGRANGTIFRLETPESDDVVPVALLGRVVTLKVEKVSEGLYRAAQGEKAVPLYTTDVVSLPLNADGTLNEAFYNSACEVVPDSTTRQYEYSGIRGNSVQFRGAYTNYGAGDGYSPDWKPIGRWSYAYAVTFGNTNYYGEVFYLNYRALMVSEVYKDGTMTFKALDGVTSVRVNSMKNDSFENGTSLSKGDIIVAVVDAKNNIVTAEKVAAQYGSKQGNLSNGGVTINNISYDLWDNYVNYANRQMLGSWGSGMQSLSQNQSITYWAFRPVYGGYTGAAARIFHSSVPSEKKDKWLELEQVNYCIVINAAAGSANSNATVTIVAANSEDSGTYKLNNLYVREVKAMSWLGDIRMHSTLLDNPVKGLGLNNPAATKGITFPDTSSSNGLNWVKQIVLDKNALYYLSGINIYSYKLNSGYIDLTELDAGVNSGMEIFYVHKSQLSVTDKNIFVINKHSENKLLYSQGKATDNHGWISNGSAVTEEYSLDTTNTIWFTLKGRSNRFNPADPTVLSNWNTGYPNKSPADYVFVFAVGNDVKFVMYEEE